MGDKALSKDQLKRELSAALKRIKELEKLEAEHLRIEKTLRESEELYKALLETSPDSVTITDLKGKIIQVSRNALRLHGVSSTKEIIGKNAFDLIVQEDREKARKNMEKTYKKGLVKDVEYKLVRQNGTQFIGELNAALVKDANQKPKAFIATVRDITERKNAEMALRESEQKYRLLIEQSIQGVVIIQNFYIIYCNSAFSKISGYSVVELLAMSPQKVKALVHPDDQALVWGRMKDRLQGKKVPNRYEFRGIQKNGSIRWLEIFSSPVEFQGKLAMQGAIIDITERKLIEESLRENEEKYRHLIEASNDGIYLLYDRKFEVVNQKFLDMFGLEKEDVQKPDFDFIQMVAPKSRPLVEERVKKSAQGIELNPKYEFTALAKDGREIEVETSVSYIKYKQGIAVQGIVRDITERKRLEEQLLQAQKLEGIGRLAGGIAHDFNNLLTSITGYAGLIQMKLETDDSIQNYIRQILRASDRASTLIQQLLAFSRKAMTKPRILNLNQVIINFKKMLQRVLGEDIVFKFFLASDLGSIRADPIQIEQIIMNLAINSRDAMPKGGSLIIETKNFYIDQEYKKKYPDLRVGYYILLIFSDTGCGMDEDIQSHIFEPFFTTKEKGEGTGLGLSTVYGIVKQSEGHITIYSEAGKGTTFKLYFPRVDEPAENIVSSPHLVVLPKGKETILVVEDDKSVREMAIEILTVCGYKVHTARSSKDTFLLWKKHGYEIDLLLTDVVMPKMSGYELAKELLELKPQLKILYMSGYTLNMISQYEVIEDEFFFIQKPFTPDGLATKIREVLDS